MTYRTPRPAKFSCNVPLCETTLATWTELRTDASEYARKNGWYISPKEDFCPAHQNYAPPVSD